MKNNQYALVKEDLGRHSGCLGEPFSSNHPQLIDYNTTDDALGVRDCLLLRQEGHKRGPGTFGPTQGRTHKWSSVMPQKGQAHESCVV